MKLLITFTLAMITLNTSGQFADNQTKIDKYLLNLIIYWGYFENYHPALYSMNLEADSVFCNLVIKVINEKRKLSFDEIASAINKESQEFNSKNALSFKKENKARHYRNHWFYLHSLDTLLLNKRVIYNDSSNQFAFNSSLRFTQPFPPIQFRILGLAKIFNIYKFYYPYPEILPGKVEFENLLAKYIRILLKCKNYLDYHLSIQKFISEFNDTHSKASSFILSRQVGDKTVPFKVRYIEKMVVVNDYYNHSLFKGTFLELGDCILEVNDENINGIFSRLKPFLSYSNSEVMFRDLAYRSLLTNSDSIKLLIKRKDSCFHTKLCTFNIPELLSLEKVKKNGSSIIFYNDSTVYLNCHYIDSSDLRIAFINHPKLKHFIFDLRSPTQWIIPIAEEFLLGKKRDFAYYYLPNTLKPGSFTKGELLSIGPSSTGKVFQDPQVYILVNENTQSQGEFQGMALQSIPNSITIGSKTAGTDGNTSQFLIPGNITITMTSIRIEYPNKKHTQSFGIAIDYHSFPRLKNIRLGIDQELKLALEIIKKGGK